MSAARIGPISGERRWGYAPRFTDLPEGTVLDLVVDDEGDKLDAAQRRALDATIRGSIEQAGRGEVAAGQGSSRWHIPAMQNPKLPWIIAAFALGCATATTGRELMVPPVQAASQDASVVATRWQYTCTMTMGIMASIKSVREEKQDEVNRLGADGWEWAGSPGENLVCFKRPY